VNLTWSKFARIGRLPSLSFPAICCNDGKLKQTRDLEWIEMIVGSCECKPLMVFLIAIYTEVNVMCSVSCVLQLDLYEISNFQFTSKVSSFKWGY